ncbi:hypothetical protein DFH27DRAFT_76513 [Peziza echinospora]|nr:hypothetical protein DFH27DRAFT_76513 [Peziza echinospora]
MPAMILPRVRPSLILVHRTSALSIRWLSSTYNPSDFSFTGSGYTSTIDTNSSTKGPLSEASLSGGHRLTPRAFRQIRCGPA